MKTALKDNFVELNSTAPCEPINILEQGLAVQGRQLKESKAAQKRSTPAYQLDLPFFGDWVTVDVYGQWEKGQAGDREQPTINDSFQCQYIMIGEERIHDEHCLELVEKQVQKEEL